MVLFNFILDVESNECGLMLPITTDQHRVTVNEHSSVTLPCIAFGRGIDISLEITKDVSKFPGKTYFALIDLK